MHCRPTDELIAFARHSVFRRTSAAARGGRGRVDAGRCHYLPPPLLTAAIFLAAGGGSKVVGLSMSGFLSLKQGGNERA